MKKALCVIGVLGIMGVSTACGTGNGGVDTRKETSARIELTNAQAAGYGKIAETGTESGDVDEVLPSEFMAYLRGMGDGSVTVDMVEWVVVPGSRAEELGIAEDDAPSGFAVNDSDAAERTVPLSGDCKVTVLVWENNNEEKVVTEEEFAEILKVRGDQGLGTPYRFAVKDGAIVSIQEQYVP